ncbi:MAG: hypothetical protein E7574_03305 [Ruminococcaceae bacterium]|nr:hypothetical protein [Oscillospiraceae bacterium]
MKNSKKSFFNNKKFKYGATAVAFTCVCIAFVIIFNVMFSALANKFLWSIDMTSTQLFTLSDATRELLKDVKSDKKITINFCEPLDKLMQNSSQNLVYQCAKEYEKAFDFIEVKYIDIITDPTAIEKFATTSNSKIKTTSVVVTSDTDFRTYTLESFFAVNSETNEVLAFDGEIKFTTAILQLVTDSPIAYFSVGHGEATGTDENTRPALWNLFKEAGYDVRTIDLSKEEFDEEAQVLIINDPQKDFQGFKSAVNEIEKIQNYIEKLGNLMVFIDPETPDLPELEALLEEWGIKVEDAVIKDFEHSYDTEGVKLDAFYPSTTTGSKLHEKLRELDSLPKSVVNYARPLSIIWKKDGSQITDSTSAREASAVLTSYDSAKHFPFANAEVSSSLKAPYNLMTITCEQKYINNQPYESYVMVIGSTDFANNDYLHNKAYSNSDILYAAMRAMGRETVPHNLESKYLENEALTITKEVANNWTLAVTIIAPIIVFAVGIVIQIRRKHL